MHGNQQVRDDRIRTFTTVVECMECGVYRHTSSNQEEDTMENKGLIYRLEQALLADEAIGDQCDGIDDRENDVHVSTIDFRVEQAATEGDERRASDNERTVVDEILRGSQRFVANIHTLSVLMIRAVCSGNTLTAFSVHRTYIDRVYEIEDETERHVTGWKFD